jgi:hypothetical protein
MLVYEHDRTEQIVSGLTKVAGAVRFFAVVAWMTLLGAVLSLAAGAVTPEARGVGALVGVAVGFLVGSAFATLARIVLEWMAQSLVAKGELLAAMKKRV